MAANSRALLPFLVFVLIFCSFAEATEFLVGGKADSWKIPSSQSDSLNLWAESSRFKIGDSLVWKYDIEKDSVLQVTKEHYVSCNASDPIEEYKDGNTKVKLNKSGPYFFISGAFGHCDKGQKLTVVVMSAKHRFVGIAPVPSPVEFDGPAVAPTSGATSLEGSLVVAFGVFVGFALI